MKDLTSEQKDFLVALDQIVRNCQTVDRPGDVRWVIDIINRTGRYSKFEAKFLNQLVLNPEIMGFLKKKYDYEIIEQGTV